MQLLYLLFKTKHDLYYYITLIVNLKELSIMIPSFMIQIKPIMSE